MKLIHRFGAVLLALALAVTAPIGIFAHAAETETAPITVSTTAQLLNLAKDCALDSFSVGRVVKLEADIDLTDCDFGGIPTFGGTFLGGGHTVSGILLTADGSNQGFFRYLQESACIQNLTVAGSVTPGGTQGTLGGIAACNSGVISDCRFQGMLTGGNTLGGIVGINNVSGTITGCSSTGTIRGKHFVGGIAGQNNGVIADSASYANVNTSAEDDQIDVSTLTLADITGTENVAAITDAGGIAGTSSGVIRACVNGGAVGYSRVGYNNGGIVGSSTGYIEGCINYGRIDGRKEVGGIVGQLEPSSRLLFTEDTLHRLARELSTLQTLTARACSDAGNSAQQISSQLSALQSQTSTASDAIQELVKQMENGMFKVGTTPVTTDLSALKNALEGISTPGTALPELPEVSLPGSDPGEKDTDDTDVTPAATGADDGTDGSPGDDTGSPAAWAGQELLLSAQAPAEKGRHIRTESNGFPSATAPAEPQLMLLADNLPGTPPISTPETPETALPDKITFDIPTVSLNNQDNITAARNSLSGSLSDISGTAGALSGQGSSASAALAADLNAITAQVTVIGNVLSDFANSSEDNRVQDVSDSDTAADTEGKVLRCINKGKVQGDLNVGGIAGAMAPENDLDPEDDVDILGSASLNANYKMRAVVRECTNSGTVSARKQDAGGIVGRQQMGAVFSCLNTGTLDSSDADNVGGIAGESSAILRNSSAKCVLLGHNKVGGIAGIGRTLTGNRAMVQLNAGNECLGAIAGTLDTDSGTNELLRDNDSAPEVKENYFVAGELEGVDGVSYAQKAEPLSYISFSQLDNLPEAFLSLTVTFMADGTVVREDTYQYGDKLSAEMPEIPEKEGCNAAWPETENSYILFDQTLEAIYTSAANVIASAEKRGERPILLVQGNYGADDLPVLSASDASPALSGGRFLESWNVVLPDNAIDGTPAKEHTVRYLVPEGADADRVELFVNVDDRWQTAKSKVDGSYLVFTAPATAPLLFCAVQATPPLWPFALGVAGILLVFGMLAHFAAKRHRKKRAAQAAKNAPRPEPAQTSDETAAAGSKGGNQ